MKGAPLLIILNFDPFRSAFVSSLSRDLFWAKSFGEKKRDGSG